MRGKIPGKDAIQLMSNDYLAIANHPDILNNQSDVLLNADGVILMSAVFLHGDSPQQRFEQRLANFMESEQGILCQSGWCANTGLIQTIADENTPVYLDMLAHTSLWEGARSAGAPAVMFHHNDPHHLERQVLKHGPGVIVVDAVYSTDGSVCPLQEIVDVGSRYSCVLVVDESHSLGTHGKQGEGIVAALGLSDRVHFCTASLAKAFAGRAGFITCSPRFSEYFKCESNPAIFSSTLLPHEVAGLDATLTVIQTEGWRRERLHANADYLRMRLGELGYNLNGSESQIISLESGTEQQTIVLRDALEARGIFGSVFCAPATPKNRAIIRFSINSNLTKVELDRITQVCADIRDDVDMENWPSSRRKRGTKNISASLVSSDQREAMLA
jgi:CAI-1 autoinducer synthase